MRLLLDTHVLLWVMADDAALSPKAKALIEQADVVYASAVSIWEIGVKVGLGKLAVDFEQLMQKLPLAGFEPLPMTWEHAAAARTLPDFHRDPFDRMLVAQAMSEPLRLVTADRLLARYSELVVTI